MKRFDIDAAAGAYEPVAILLRGREYVLGVSAAQLLRVNDLRAQVKGEAGEDKVAFAARLVGPAVRALAPELGPVLDEAPLTAAEELALMAPIGEVLGQLGRFRPTAG